MRRSIADHHHSVIWMYNSALTRVFNWKYSEPIINRDSMIEFCQMEISFENMLFIWLWYAMWNVKIWKNWLFISSESAASIDFAYQITAIAIQTSANAYQIWKKKMIKMYSEINKLFAAKTHSLSSNCRNAGCEILRPHHHHFSVKINDRVNCY